MVGVDTLAPPRPSPSDSFRTGFGNRGSTGLPGARWARSTHQGPAPDRIGVRPVRPDRSAPPAPARGRSGSFRLRDMPEHHRSGPEHPPDRFVRDPDRPGLTGAEVRTGARGLAVRRRWEPSVEPADRRRPGPPAPAAARRRTCAVSSAGRPDRAGGRRVAPRRPGPADPAGLRPSRAALRAARPALVRAGASTHAWGSCTGGRGSSDPSPVLAGGVASCPVTVGRCRRRRVDRARKGG
jgi:hypothetical protein